MLFNNKAKMLLGVCISLLLLIIPIIGSSYYSHVGIILLINIVLASSYRLLYATGLVSFCHVTFFGLGAYTSAILATRLEIPFFLCFLSAGVLPGIVAGLLAWPTVRARGAAFFIITFGFWVVVDSIFAHWTSVTQGRLGIKSIPPLFNLYSSKQVYFIVLVFALIMLFVLYRLYKMKFGEELLAIGDSDTLSEIIGLNINKYRIMAFVIGATIAGLTGSIYAHYMGFISPHSFGLWFTVYIMIWCVLGGEQEYWGPIAGAALMTIINELFRMSGALQAIFYAATLLVVILTLPHGIAGFIHNKKLNKQTHLSSKVILKSYINKIY